MGFVTRLIDAIYPPQCAGCMTLTDAPHGLCPSCWRQTDFITGAVCHICSTPLPGEAAVDLTCDACLTNPPAWQTGRAAVLYQGTGRRVILSLKHGDRLDLARTLAGWMHRTAPDLVARADIVAPVPLHWKRLMRRRYNQSAELARQPALSATAQFIPDLLTRTRPTPSQDGLSRAERYDNQSGAFSVTPRHITALAGHHVLLVDDVMTTGATLSACAETLHTAGAAEVNVLALARVAKEGFSPI